MAALAGGVFGARGLDPVVNAMMEMAGTNTFQDRLYISPNGAHETIGIVRLAGNGSGVFFWNAQNHVRLGASVYPDGRLSNFGLVSKNVDINPKVLFRMDGANPGPMVFFKNNRDQHRIDLGLDINSEDEDAYLVYFDNRGEQHAVFGRFPYVKNACGGV